MLVLSWLYAMITTVRNFLYDSKILNSEKVEGVEVICIGNITVGGTGKTPIVQYFAKKYINEGKKVAIVSRGYKGKRSVDPLIVSNYENIIATVEESGDEPYLHAIALPKIPVIVARKRIEGVKLAKKEFQVDVVILDDGFQHRQLYRDKNIILIDATDPFGDQKLLPSGRLRESLKGLNRANEIIITKTNLAGVCEVDQISSELEKYSKSIRFSHFNSSLLINGDVMNTKLLLGLHVMVVSAIAKPENIYKTVSSFRPNQIEQKIFLDHHHYTAKDIELIYRLKEQMVIDYFVTTEKDWVKISKFISSRHKKDWVVIKQNYFVGEKLETTI